MNNFRKDCEAAINKYNQVKETCYINLQKIGNSETDTYLKEMYYNLIDDCNRSINEINNFPRNREIFINKIL